MSSAPVLSFAPDVGDVHVDLDELLMSRLLVTGTSRSGKSRLARQLIEQADGRVSFHAIDPEGEFWSLREALLVIIVGRGGDIPADVATAAVLARRLVALRVSVVIDLSDLRPDEQDAYVAAYVGGLMSVAPEDGHPTLVIVDEAQRFAAEGGALRTKEGAPTALAELADLAGRGGKRGFCLVAVTPRLSDLSKTLVGMLGNLFVFRLTLDTDVRRAGGMLGMSKAAERAEIMTLPRGTCYAYGPAVNDSAPVVRVRGLPALRTTHPDVKKLGARPVAPPAPEAVRALLGELQDVAAQAAAEADETASVAELEATVKSLRAQLAERATITPAQLDQAARDGRAYERRVIEDRAATAYATASDVVALLTAKVLAPLTGLLPNAERAAGDTGVAGGLVVGVEERVDDVGDDSSNVVQSLRTSAPATVTAAECQLDDSPATASNLFHLTPARQRILDTLAQLHSLGLSSVLRPYLALFAGASPKSSAFGIHLGALVERGLIAYPSRGAVALTETGAELTAPSARVKPTRSELQRAWLDRLPASQARILEHLLPLYPASMHRFNIAAALGVSAKSSSFGIDLGALFELGLVHYPEKGYVAASALLFPEGLT